MTTITSPVVVIMRPCNSHHHGLTLLLKLIHVCSIKRIFLSRSNVLMSVEMVNARGTMCRVEKKIEDVTSSSYIQVATTITEKNAP